MEEKKVILVVSPDGDRLKFLSDVIARHVTDPTIFFAGDGVSGLAKLKNVPPHVLICDTELAKLSGLKLIDQALLEKIAAHTAYILVGPPPEEERHLDELVTGQVQYWTHPENESELITILMRALNFSSHSERAEFHLRFLAPNEVLLKEGDQADFVYFVRKGQLRAVKGTGDTAVVLGSIEVGEFVGEMAYINGEARSANVTAVTDCELIEVPLGHFDRVLFKRPSWSKALMLTLSKRIKAANDSKVRGT